MFSELCGISVGIIWLYALLIFVAPDWFFGTYLYKGGVWNDFKRTLGTSPTNQGILTHLLWGVSLSWLSWGGTGYLAAIYYVENPDSRRVFALGNVALWASWCLLDSYVRSKNLYSAFASSANFVLVAGMTAGWVVVASVQ